MFHMNVRILKIACVEDGEIYVSVSENTDIVVCVLPWHYQDDVGGKQSVMLRMASSSG